MAISTFGKQFTVKPDKADEFVAEMTKATAPTLYKEFQSSFVYLSQEKDLKQSLLKALN